MKGEKEENDWVVALHGLVVAQIYRRRRQQIFKPCYSLGVIEPHRIYQQKARACGLLGTLLPTRTQEPHCLEP